MLTRADIKFVKSLGDKSERYASRLFVAEGSKSVLDLLASGLHPEVLYAEEDWIIHHEEKIGSVRTEVAGAKSLEQMSSLKSTREVIALFQMPEKRYHPKHLSGLVLALDGLQDPGNLGTLIRLADWYGIAHMICSEDTVDCYNAKVVQATMGSLGRVSVHYLTMEHFIRDSELPVLGADMHGKDARAFSFPKDCVLLLGKEGSGIRPSLKKMLTHTLRIEKRGHAESLNAAVAGAILTDRYFGQHP